MNDDELITVLREQRGKVPMTTPVEQVISRGRAVRARRRAPQVAAAFGTAAAAAIAVTAAWPVSHAAVGHHQAGAPAAVSHPEIGPGAQLAAWTVTKLADGSIQVTLRQAADPAGLQRLLRADGVPVSVTFIGQQNPACQPYGANGAPKWPFAGKKGSGALGLSSPVDAYKSQGLLVIHPSSLPSGAGLQIEVMQNMPSSPSGPWPYAKGSGHPVLEVFLVKASPQCTGS